MTAAEPICGGLDHPEAVAWDARREVLFCGGEAGQLYAVTLDGVVEVVAETGGSLLGLALDEAGWVYACDAGKGRVVAIDPDRGAAVPLTDLPMTEPNGIAIDPQGNIYVSDSGKWGGADGRLLRITATGRTEVWSAGAPAFPNGCLVRDGALLVVESERHRVLSIPIQRDGSAAPPHQVLELPPSVPDQIAFDSTGGIVVGCYRPDVVFHASRGGELVRLVDDPSGIRVASPTGCAFAGADLSALVIAGFGAGHLLRLETRLAGDPVARPPRGAPIPDSGSF